MAYYYYVLFGPYLSTYSEIIILKKKLSLILFSHSLASTPICNEFPPMLKPFGKWTSNSIPLLPNPNTQSVQTAAPFRISLFCKDPLKIRIKQAYGTLYRARRRVIYDDDDDDDEEYGYNEELGMLESYTQSVNDEILLVQAELEDEQVEVLIYKGFSSCLNYRTSSNPSTSVLPAKAKIKSIDRAKGPFDPSNIHYIERGLTILEFKTRLPH